MANWRHATNLVALDLEGSGAQDGAEEAILEIAAVRLVEATLTRPPPTPPASTPGGPFPHDPGSHPVWPAAPRPARRPWTPSEQNSLTGSPAPTSSDTT